MYISPVSFKANYFKVHKYGCYDTTVEVISDKPEIKPETYKEGMIFDGKPVLIDRLKFQQNIALAEQKLYNYEPEQVLVNGEAEGKLVFRKNTTEENIKSLNEPVILVLEKECSDEFWKFLHPDYNNIKSLIFTDASREILSHFASLCRGHFDFASVIYDTKRLKELESLEGKTVSVAKGLFKEIPVAKNNSQSINAVVVPKLRKVEGILSFEDCEKDTVGNKAYNLKRLRELVKSGILKDVIVPEGFVLPYSYLEGLVEYRNNGGSLLRGKYFDEITKKIDELNIGKNIMVRSAFNGEDLERYSASGLYVSRCISSKEALYGILEVINSKNSAKARNSRLKHGISDEDIVPSVIIQKPIFSDFVFTLYTQNPLDNDDIMLLEIKEPHPGELFRCQFNPNVIVYDKKKNILTVKSEQNIESSFMLDEDLNVISQEKMNNSKLPEIWDSLKKLMKQALIIEKKFGKPQDIEGGIHKGQIYLWQTRNIVKKIPF